MSAIANVVLADSVPVNKTLYPIQASVDKSMHIERAANSASGNRTLTIGLSMAHSKRPTDRVTVQYASPKEAQVDGVWTVVGVRRCTIEYVLLADDTELERNNFSAEVMNLAATTAVRNTIKRDPQY